MQDSLIPGLCHRLSARHSRVSAVENLRKRDNISFSWFPLFQKGSKNPNKVAATFKKIFLRSKNERNKEGEKKPRAFTSVNNRVFFDVLTMLQPFLQISSAK